jgi:hypothetical protein
MKTAYTIFTINGLGPAILLLDFFSPYRSTSKCAKGRQKRLIMVALLIRLLSGCNLNVYK